MKREQLETRFLDWAARYGIHVGTERLDDAETILVYDAGESDTTLTGVAVQAVAAHTDRIHVFLFAKRLTWEKAEDGDTVHTIEAKYKLLLKL